MERGVGECKRRKEGVTCVQKKEARERNQDGKDTTKATKFLADFEKVCLYGSYVIETPTCENVKTFVT